MDSTPSTRSRNRSPRASTAASGQNRSVAQPPAPNVSTQDWIEPPLASPIPSFEDHGGGPYGVLEDMQALGSRPTAKVRGRVKPDGPRKNALNKSLANPMATASNQATPETTPAPMEVLPEQPLVIVDDERDDDYTPRPSKKPAKARLSRSAAINAKSTASPKPTTPSVTASETPVPSSVATPVASATPVAPPVAPPASSAPTAPARHPPNPLPKDEVIRHLKAFDRVVPIPSDPDQRNLHNVVKAAVRKSMEVGNKILGLAIQDVYLESFSNPRLVHLLKGILDQTSTPGEIAVFREHINQAKKKIKAKETAMKKKLPSEIKRTSSPAPEMVPRPSIENQAVPRKPKISLKMTKNTKAVSKPVDSPAPLPAKTKPRASSISSSSSLSSLTSIEETPEPQALMAPHYSPPPYPPRSTVAPTTLAAPVDTNGSGKRSSMEAGNDEDDRQFQAKKQKLDETVNRDAPTEESHVRPDLSAIPKVHKNLMVPPVQLTASDARSRDISADAASSLTEVSSPLSSTSRRNTPKRTSMPAKLFKKKAKTKNSYVSPISGTTRSILSDSTLPRIRDYDYQNANHNFARRPVKKQAPGQSADEDGTSRRASPGGPDVNEESDNNDYCTACNTSGFLLCCDGCDSSFHLHCLDPPLSQDAPELNEAWYCFGCTAKRAQPQRHSRGLFAALLLNLDKRNPSNFVLPQDIREYFDGVATAKDGKFVEQLATKTRRGAGYDELPDHFKTKDAKGQAILCYNCSLSSLGRREIITCDQCSAHWHLDCLDPPLANAPYRDHTGRKIRDWLCPLHADHALRAMEVPRLADRQFQRERRIHMRRPRGAKVVDTALNRDFINDGVIEIANDSSDDDSEFEEVDVSGVVYRLPEKGIKLDFIDRVRRGRAAEQYYSNPQAYSRPNKRRAMEQTDFFRRSFVEQRTALDLVGLANQQADLDFNGDQVSGLLTTLIAEAPADVVAQMIEAEKEAKSSDTTGPPSPPASDQHTEQSLAQQRKSLELLQTLIARKLAAMPDQ
ncbi:hypothetical protein D6C78_02767 [Aureobasidium pullulans]|uniref:PHD-type domain-containing protein n=1 Tax=Aureobasidium pullulans TaxID=5580 RepID=A0A4T0C694_AURPU|nr:hypothetical protein D6C78_02767 [Aureobasidium pullulans]